MRITVHTDEHLLIGICFATLQSSELTLEFPQGITAHYQDVLESFSSYGKFVGVGRGATVCMFAPELKKKISIESGSFLKNPLYYLLPLLWMQSHVQLQYSGPTLIARTQKQNADHVMSSIEGLLSMLRTYIDVKQKVTVHSFGGAGVIQLGIDSRLKRIQQLSFATGHPHAFRLFIESDATNKELMQELQTYAELGLRRQAPVALTTSSLGEPGIALSVLGQFNAEHNLPLCSLHTLAYEDVPDKKELEGLLALLLQKSVGTHHGFGTSETKLLLPLFLLVGGSLPIENYEPQLQDLVEIAEEILGISIVYGEGSLITKGANRGAEELVFLEE